MVRSAIIVEDSAIVERIAAMNEAAAEMCVVVPVGEPMEPVSEG